MIPDGAVSVASREDQSSFYALWEHKTTDNGEAHMQWSKDIAWKRFDERGEERCGFACHEGSCGTEGVGAVAINGSGFVFQYRIETDEGWRVRRAGIVTRLGADEFTAMIERNDEGAWTIGGVRTPRYDRCEDIDLGFSPSTNTLTLKRLALVVGETRTTRAILVTEPELMLSMVKQSYHRIDEQRYEYRVGDFSVVITVDEDGLVVDYPGMFKALQDSPVG